LVVEGVTHNKIWLPEDQLTALGYQVGQMVKRVGVQETASEGKVLSIRKEGKGVVYEVEFPTTCELKDSELVPAARGLFG
jgi:hypothetical protein